jgi:uncharacterized RDD family membrane protein YckC
MEKETQQIAAPISTHTGTKMIAPIGARTVAFVIDFVVFFVVTSLMEYLLSYIYFGFIRLFTGRIGDINQAIHFDEMLIMDLIITLVFCWFYYIQPLVKTGQTLGKKLLKIKVVDMVSGQLLSKKLAIVRTLAYIISVLPFGCGYIMFIFHPRRQALHDLLSRSITIRSVV